MYKGRNQKERDKLQKQLEALKAEFHARINELEERDEREPMSDEAFNTELHRINAENESKSNAIITLLYALEYPQIKNEWFTNFVNSFGICTSKKITAKQAEIFVKYGEQTHERDNARRYGLEYRGRVNNLYFKADYYGISHYGYVTIIDLSTLDI